MGASLQRENQSANISVEAGIRPPGSVSMKLLLTEKLRPKTDICQIDDRYPLMNMNKINCPQPCRNCEDNWMIPVHRSSVVSIGDPLQQMNKTARNIGMLLLTGPSSGWGQWTFSCSQPHWWQITSDKLHPDVPGDWEVNCWAAEAQTCRWSSGTPGSFSCSCALHSLFRFKKWMLLLQCFYFTFQWNFLSISILFLVQKIFIFHCQI